MKYSIAFRSIVPPQRIRVRIRRHNYYSTATHSAATRRLYLSAGDRWKPMPLLWLGIPEPAFYPAAFYPAAG